jgi:aminoglycoside phosphotransferase (APT) family kinase protein
MGREFRILSALAPVWPKVPRPIAYCEDARVIGTPFYVMDRVKGVILRARLPPDLELGDKTMRRLSEAACDTLAEIHRIDWRAAGLGDLGRPEGYVERQVRGWTDRWRKARTDDVPDMEKLGAWLDEHRPPESGATLVHNDFKYDNFVLAPDLSGVIAVLDWEMATIGDPLSDLGLTLCYWSWASPPQSEGITSGPGWYTRDQFVNRYSERTGRDVTHLRYYEVLGVFKLAVIIQQIYHRFHCGQTHDERFRHFDRRTRDLVSLAARMIHP